VTIRIEMEVRSVLCQGDQCESIRGFKRVCFNGARRIFNREKSFIWIKEKKASRLKLGHVSV
ncbi:MAG TPA: hypothetical protein ACQGQI_08165, partial [Xylella sp.]